MNTVKSNAMGLYLEAIRDGHPKEAAEKYIGKSYKQHSTGIRDGKEGFVEFFEPFLANNPIRDIQIVRALQDGPNAFFHVYQSLNRGEAEWVTMDFFDSDEDGKIVEHWDAVGAFYAQNPSGRSSTDGATEITDLDQTEANKALVRGFVEDCLIARHADKLADYVSEVEYLQHNPKFPDGIDALSGLLADSTRPLRYDSLFLLVGEGNFVATLSRAHWGDEHDLCQADLFRVVNGKIVEHWDNSEPVPPREEWVNSGKF